MNAAVTDLALFGDEVPSHLYIENASLIQSQLSQGLHMVVATSTSESVYEILLLDLQGMYEAETLTCQTNCLRYAIKCFFYLGRVRSHHA